LFFLYESLILKEQEVRLNHLRAQRGDHLIQFQSSEESSSAQKPTQHVNLFQLEEQGVSIEFITEYILFSYI
jgi:hypothetical protein